MEKTKEELSEICMQSALDLYEEVNESIIKQAEFLKSLKVVPSDVPRIIVHDLAIRLLTSNAKLLQLDDKNDEIKEILDGIPSEVLYSLETIDSNMQAKK